MPKIVSANRLPDGTVVYLDRDDAWTPSIDLARAFVDDTEAAAGLTRAREDARRNVVIDPFLVPVEADTASPRPLSLRDAIRARGPTIDYAPKPPTPSA